MNGRTTMRIDLAHPINVLILYATALAPKRDRFCSSTISTGTTGSSSVS